MRTTITLPETLFNFVDKARTKTCHSRSSYIAFLIKKAMEGAGVTQKKTPRAK